MKIYKDPPQPTWPKLCLRPAAPTRDLDLLIAEVFHEVKTKGDQALRAYTKRFDGVELNTIAVTTAEVSAWSRRIPLELRHAIDEAYTNIRRFHSAQAVVRPQRVETSKGVWCWREARPIERVGLYVPGGTAPLVSTVLMLGVPAQLAGCRQVTLCTPPRSDGTIDPAICYAARKTGVTTIVRVGGSQAIAALALGTESIGRVDKLFGPGNRFVTTAKQYAAANYQVAIDMPAGPSEVMVLADATARPEFVAADLLSQAEHGPDSQAVLVATEPGVVSKVQYELKRQLAVLPRRAIAEKALANSFCVTLQTMEQVLAFANTYAPEHLILSVARPAAVARHVQNAGSVFLGNYAPESAGDYASGTNHTLPTNGWARMSGGVSLDSFVKQVTFQTMNRRGLHKLAPTVQTLAEAEGLQAHANAVAVRLRKSTL